MEAVPTLDARTQINALSGIATDTANRLPLEFFNTIGGANRPADIYNSRRYENLAFLRGFLKRNAEDPVVQRATETLQELRLRNEPPGNLKVGEAPLQPVNPALFDRLETLDLSLRGLLTIEDVGRRDELAKEIRAQTDASTKETLEKIDGGERVIEDVIIVGGGLLTSAAATTLAYAGANVTVISNQELGEPWLDQPIFINSATRARFGGVDLPLLEGSTTPITPSFQNNAIGADALLDLPGEVLRVNCKDPQVPTREYVAGTGLGLLDAVNIVGATRNVLTNQSVNADELKVNTDGTKTLTIVDKETGTTRTIDGKLVIFLTGPGKERFGIKDTQTKEAYDTGATKLREDITNAQQEINTLNEQIIKLPEGNNERLELEARRNAITVELPKILSFTLVKEAYKFWVENGRRNPSPLEPLLGVGTDTPVKTAIAGGGDTALVEAELILGRAPNSAYPTGFDRTGVNAEATIYNPPSDNTEDFRVRYQGVVGDSRVTKLPKVKVVSAREEGNKVVIATDGGDEAPYDYLFVSTGLEPSPVPLGVKAALEAQGQQFGDIVDVSRQPQRVALGNADLGIVIAGSATNFTAKDFPPQIRQLIETLQIRENTISVWVNSLLVQRCLLSLGIRKQIPLQPTTEKIYAGVPTRPLRPEEADLAMSLRELTNPQEVQGKSPNILTQQGLYTGIFEQARPYSAFELVRIAEANRSTAIKSNPRFLISVLESVGNQLVDVRRLNASSMSVGAERIIRGENIRQIESDLKGRFQYSDEQYTDALYGYFGAGLGVGSPGFIAALDRIATIQQRPIREVIDEVLPIINAVRLERPDLNNVGGIRGGERSILAFDDAMRQEGYFWNQEQQNYQFVDIRQYPSDINDPRVAALIRDGQVIINNIRLDRRTEVYTENTREAQAIVETYMQEIAQNLIIESISNSDLLLNEIIERRFTQLGARIIRGAEAALRGTQISELEAELRRFNRSVTDEQVIDYLYGYFAAGLTLPGCTRVVNNRYPQVGALNRIAALKSNRELRTISVQEVIEEVLPLFNKARRERPDIAIRGGSFKYEQDEYLQAYGFNWDGDKYVKRT